MSEADPKITGKLLIPNHENYMRRKCTIIAFFGLYKTNYIKYDFQLKCTLKICFCICFGTCTGYNKENATIVGYWKSTNNIVAKKNILNNNLVYLT